MPGPVDAPVGIVGAGPVGLTAAARLASFGVPSVVLEADPYLRKQGSKACLIQGDVLEVLDKFGCAEPIDDEGVTWHVARTYVRNRVIRSTVFPERIGFGPFVNISQYRIEQVLLARVQSDPLSELRWSHRVTGVAQDGDGVQVEAETPGGTVTLRFRYLVACDGVRSAVRELTGANWTGYTHKDLFLITDIRAKLPLAQERHFHYDPSFNRGRQVIMHPQPHDVWRIDWQLPPDADIDAERASGAFDARVRAVIGDVPYEVDWLSTYRFNQRVVERFVDGGVLFAGDAAHSLPPYGSRGMNSGIQDADNLAWKLALVFDGRAGDDLVATYHDERYAAARENLAVTEATIRFMVPPSRARRWARSALLRLSHPFRAARDRVNSGRMAEPFVYADSPLIGPEGGHPLLGHFAPDGWTVVDGEQRRARRLYGDGFVALWFGDDVSEARQLAMALQGSPPALATRLVLVLRPGTAPGPLPPGTTVVHDEDGELRATYQLEPRGWALVRPDGHVAAAATGRLDPPTLDIALARSALLRSGAAEPASEAAAASRTVPA